MFKKLSAAVVATALFLSGTAQAAASPAQALSVSKSPAVRAGTTAKSVSKQEGGLSALYVIGGIIAVVAVLELTGVTNIFGDGDPDSP